MKHFLLCLFLLFVTLFGQSQINSVGKNRANVMLDLMGCNDTINCSVHSTYWFADDTLIISVYRVSPNTLTYHPIYYFVNDICVHQRVICLKPYTWSSGFVSVIVDEIKEYNIADIYPVHLPSSYYDDKKNSAEKTIIKNNIPPKQIPK